MRHLQLQQSRRSALRALVFLPLTAAVLLTAGCGKGAKNKVTGTVTLGDSPVAGTVVFKGESKDYECAINNKGEYTIMALPKGSYKVYIKAPPPGSMPVIPPGGMPKMDGPGGADKPPVAPPPSYTDVATSGLTLEHEGGPKEFNLVLKGNPGQ